mgnify:CR=1 FL=1|jgi:hypothetical protein
MANRNNIMEMQAKSEMMRLIWARDETYRAAKHTQGWFVFGTAAVPVIGAFTSGFWPDLKPALALFSLMLLFLDVGLLDRLQKERLKLGAKLQEEFDTKAFELPWNKFVAGDKVAPEDVTEAASAPIPAKRQKEIETWYEACVSQIPIAYGRLVCQRTNIAYDSRLRRRYGNWLFGSILVLAIILLVADVLLDTKFTDVILGLSMITPMLAWALREHRKQLDTCNSLQNLQSEFKTVWNNALEGASEEELKVSSRQLQDAIYQHRASAPLVFDWVYILMRSKNESEAHVAATEFVKQAEEVLSSRGAG